MALHEVDIKGMPHVYRERQMISFAAMLTAYLDSQTDTAFRPGSSDSNLPGAKPNYGYVYRGYRIFEPASLSVCFQLAHPGEG